MYQKKGFFTGVLKGLEDKKYKPLVYVESILNPIIKDVLVSRNYKEVLEPDCMIKMIRQPKEGEDVILLFRSDNVK
jgi:hypothetical protein